MFFELSNDSSCSVNQAQSLYRYNSFGDDSVEGDAIVENDVMVNEESNILREIPCADVDENVVCDVYKANVDVQ